MKKSLAAVSALLFIIPAVSFAAGPSITLFGGQVSMNPGTSYVEPGYSANSPTDGDITANVFSSNNIQTNQPGNYSVNYTVTDSTLATADAVRTVTVNGFGGISNPCITNGTCPCPFSYQTDPKAWKACAFANFPKLPNGSALVCRLQPLMPGETTLKCAADQAGFWEMELAADGTETYR